MSRAPLAREAVHVDDDAMCLVSGRFVCERRGLPLLQRIQHGEENDGTGSGSHEATDEASHADSQKAEQPPTDEAARDAHEDVDDEAEALALPEVTRKEACDATDHEEQDEAHRGMLQQLHDARHRKTVPGVSRATPGHRLGRSSDRGQRLLG